MMLRSSANKSSKEYDEQCFSFSNFEKAKHLFQEIENLLEHELADTPLIAANYDQHHARKKSKRKRGPYLIKALGTAKSRKVNEMEYDPELKIWLGNEDSLKPFASPQPVLFPPSKVRGLETSKHGKMTWDPKEKKWRGNEEELLPFQKRQPALIRNLNNDVIKEIGGMRFDAVSMRWLGNDEALTDFDTSDLIDSSNIPDDGFVVGNEFHLSQALQTVFQECAQRHKEAIQGWVNDERTRTHLHVIRTMSILRLVRDVKYRRATASSNNDGGMGGMMPLHDSYNIPERDLPTNTRPTPSVTFANVAESDNDNWDDMNFGTGSVRIKLKKPEASDLDPFFDALDQEPVKEEKDSKPAEEWDDFSSEDVLGLTQKLGSGTGTIGRITRLNKRNSGSISGSIGPAGSGSIGHTGSGSIGPSGSVSKHPFALLHSDDPRRRSYQNMLPIQKLFHKPAQEDEESEDGFELPKGPLELKIKAQESPANGASNPDALTLEDIEEGDVLGEPFDQEDELEPQEEEERDNEVFDEEVEEVFRSCDSLQTPYYEGFEEWNDVEVPPALGEPVTKRPAAQQFKNAQPQMAQESWDEEEWIPEKLVLKARPASSNTPSSTIKHRDEEAWDDVDIPENLPTLARKK